MSTTTNPSSSSSSAGTGGSGGGGGGGPCGACKFLRRKCVPGCIFAPYFDAEQGATHFAAVHKVFGASNVSKLLLHIPVHKRLDAVITICYEAQARLRDPVYGCVSHIFALQQQVVNLQAELSYLQAHLATLELPPPQPQPQPQPNLVSTTAPPLSISDLPSSTAAYDLSTLFDPTQLQSSSAFSTWTMQPRQVMDQPRPQQFSSGGGGDLQALARELLDRHHESPPQPLPPPPCSNIPSSHTVSKGDH